MLERHGHRAAVPFGSLIYEPGNNIWAWPGDTIYLYKEPQTYLAFGASGQQGQFQFTAGSQSSAWRMTLAEAVAAAGGLLDLQADPGSVFLYRREPRELAEKLGVDCSKMDGPTVPIVYSVSALPIRQAISSRPGCRCITRTSFLLPTRNRSRSRSSQTSSTS